MLDNATINQLKDIFHVLSASYELNVSVDPKHPSRGALLDLLNGFASSSEKISVIENVGEGLRFSISKDKEETGISFRAVPSGHEFTSLILAVLNADGKGKNLPDGFILKRIEALKGDIKLSTYMSLSCTNCPDVVQALNIIALLNENVSHEAVDGAINQQEVDSLGIQSVPTVFCNGESFHIGRGDLGVLLDKLEAKFESDSISQTEEKMFDIIIAGGGPAGTTAAVYSARKGLNVAVVCTRVGGQVNETVDIENLISVGKTTGTELGIDLKERLIKNGVTVLENRTIEKVAIEGDDDLKVLHLKGGEAVKAKQLIIATGASWRKLNVEGEDEYIGRGVAFCPHCDGPLFKDKHVAVIGGGNSGIEAAIDLSGVCERVTVLEFLENLKADSVLVDKARGIENIEIITNTATSRIVGDGSKVISLTRKDRASEEVMELSLDGIFVQIGLVANSAVFKDVVDTTDAGEILITKDCRTSTKGIYAAGDVTTVTYKQIVISMGEGAKAALSAFDDRIRS